MYNSQKSIWLFFVLIGLSLHSFGQNIRLGDMTSLKTKNPINVIYDNYIFDNKIVLLADSRKMGRLDVLIIVLNQNKEVIREQIIGTETTFDHPIGLIKNKKGYSLFTNSFENGKTKLKLYDLDKAFLPQDYKSIQIENLNEVTTFQYNINDQKLLLTATVTDTSDRTYPQLIRYDLTQNKILSTIDFNRHTDKRIVIHEKDTVPESIVFDKKTKQYIGKGKKVVYRYNPVSKECNQTKCLNDDCSEILLIGQVKSLNFTDFWVSKVKDDHIVWENIYKTRLGGDVARDVFFDPVSKNILVGGVGYNKIPKNKEDDGYHYRVLQIDENGKLLKSHVYKKKENDRSRYLQMKPIGDHYIVSGHTENVTFAEMLMGDDTITLSDLYFVLIDKNGDFKKEKTIETKSIDVFHSCVVLSPKKMLFIFSEDEEMKILDVMVME